jgi:hypothetical protein
MVTVIGSALEHGGVDAGQATRLCLAAGCPPRIVPR